MSSADGDNIQDLYLKLMARGRAIPVDFSDDGTHKEKELDLLKEILSSVLRYTSRIQDHEYAGRVNPDRVRLTVFPSAKVQAATTWLDPFHVIGINRGLMLFVYRVARVVAPYIIDPPEAPRPPMEESAERLGTLIDWMASPLAAPWISADWKVGPRAARTAENVAQASERFVIAHEVAHILLGHRIQQAPGPDAVGVTVESLDERESDQEIAADASGLILTIDSMTTDGFAAQAAAVGVFFFLWCLAIAEDVGAIDPGQTHQSAQLRDQLLRAAVQMKYGASGGAVLSWADDITA